MSDEPENLTLALLRKLDRKMDALGTELRADIADAKAELRAEMRSLRADVASDMMDLDKRLSEQERRLSDQIVGLRCAVVESHSSAVGHGVLLSELEERLSRVERHVGLASETH
ncbi:MAG: hypothetical protein ACR652_02810 [Methylocystis sp.]|uniref:hypothetical protein n=1 Tax=Methylocystis sp. TaxID=1911079 RepID=UPI003DA3A0FD